jgi:polyisoprenoid-binding protein YceI
MGLARLTEGEAVMSTTAVEIPGYIAGTYTIDPGHSDVAFTVRHLMVSKVRGHFTRFQGELTLAPDPVDSSVTATIELASIDTNNPNPTATSARPTSSRPTPTRR